MTSQRCRRCGVPHAEHPDASKGGGMGRILPWRDGRCPACLDLSQFRDSGGEDSGGSDGSGDDGDTQRTVVEVDASGTKGYVEPVIRFDGEIIDEPSGESYTLYRERGGIAFSTRDGWMHAFVVAGDVVDVACPEGVTVTVDGEVWTEE